MVVHVSLPMVQTAAEADVDIGSRALKVSVPGKCRLTLQLPCAVDESGSKAKWLKAKKELVITMPKI